MRVPRPARDSSPGEFAGEQELPGYADVVAAAGRLAGVARRTPLIAGTPLDALTGARVLLKAECLQVTGSFKIRGAWNRLAQLGPAERAAGVVAFSSGNHAQGVAEAARRLGIPATIVMPADAPRAKLDNTRALGAEVVTYDRLRESREEIAGRLAAERGATLVPSYDDPHVIAGQGTVGLEIAEQAEEVGLVPDDVVICCSGGGLASGSALALHEHAPQARVWVAEPAGFDDTRRSLEAGTRLSNDTGGHSFCDALLAPTPGRLTFALMRQRVSGGLAVTDDEVRAAMVAAFRHLRLVVEPGGAVALAALLAGRLPCRGRTVAVVLSGGNVDPSLYGEVITAA
ncbi:MAG: threonine/serine dehydratase [Steroidobacteraceae bacterium]|jgi:threonine dehydratase|nr:threonine/serine dehydratase [Steroidobacteraceae bacterium]